MKSRIFSLVILAILSLAVSKTQAHSINQNYIANTVPIVVVASLTANQFNAICIALAKTAMVTTYTYKPLVGTITAGNPCGATTNYSYDTFNRFQAIKNFYRRVIQNFEYNYQH